MPQVTFLGGTTSKVDVAALFGCRDVRLWMTLDTILLRVRSDGTV